MKISIIVFFMLRLFLCALGVQMSVLATGQPAYVTRSHSNLLQISPTSTLLSPQLLTAIWAEVPLPLSAYSPCELAFQAQINSQSVDFVSSYPQSSDHYLLHDMEEITPFTWKWIDAEVVRGDSTYSKVSLRRPNWWLLALGANRVGKRFFLDLPGMGFSDTVKITAVRPNLLDTRILTIEEERPITGKFEHFSNQVLNLYFHNDDKLGVTANHLIWSYDRGDWVPAVSLSINEMISTYAGRVKLKRMDRMLGWQKVYNLEVYRDHSFYVSRQAIRVHNDCFSLDSHWRSMMNEATNFLNPGKEFKTVVQKGLTGGVKAQIQYVHRNVEGVARIIVYDIKRESGKIPTTKMFNYLVKVAKDAKASAVSIRIHPRLGRAKGEHFGYPSLDMIGDARAQGFVIKYNNEEKALYLYKQFGEGK